MVGFLVFLACAVAPAKPPDVVAPNYTQVKTWVVESKIKSVEELLEQMPVEWVAAVAFVYSSRSQHASSFDHPRIILFGPESEYIFAISGESEDPTYRCANDPFFNFVEMIEFSTAQNRFFFHALNFNDAYLRETAFNPAVDKPADCFTCHRSTNLVIWDSYRFWPGVYGSANEVDDKVELQKFSNFVKVTQNNRRYRALLRFAPRFADKMRYLDDSHVRPGFQLEFLAGKWRNQQIKATPQYAAYEYAFMAVNYCSETMSFDKFLPGSLAGSFDERIRRMLVDQNFTPDRKLSAYANLKAATLTARENHLQERKDLRLEILKSDAKLDADEGKMVAIQGYERVAAVRYLIEGRGISMADWFISFRKFSYDGDRLGPVTPEREKVLVATEPKLQTAYDEQMNARSNRVGVGSHNRSIAVERAPLCEQLRRASINALRKSLGQKPINF